MRLGLADLQVSNLQEQAHVERALVLGTSLNHLKIGLASVKGGGGRRVIDRGNLLVKLDSVDLLLLLLRDLVLLGGLHQDDELLDLVDLLVIGDAELLQLQARCILGW